MCFENIMVFMGKKDVFIVNVVLKIDVCGILEVLYVVFVDFVIDEVKVCIIGLGVGVIIEFDVILVEFFEVVFFGFNVCVDNVVC